MNSKQQARKIYALCVASARQLTYGEVLEHLGYSQPVSGNAIRYGLELVRIACKSRDLPVLTAIVVNKSTGTPADTALPKDDASWDRQVQDVLAYKKWPSVDEIDWDYVWDNRQKLSAQFGFPHYWTNH